MGRVTDRAEGNPDAKVPGMAVMTTEGKAGIAKLPMTNGFDETAGIAANNNKEKRND